MADFYFAVGSDPCDVFIVVNGQWVPYKHCEYPEIAKAIVDGQNEVLSVSGVCQFEEREETHDKN